MLESFFKNFLGSSPIWYKVTIISFLVINPLLFYTIGGFLTGWILVAQFIFTLAMALKCYPLLPGGLLAFEAVAIGMASTEKVYEEALLNFPVILLLMFMVAGIHFMREFLVFLFSRIFLAIRSKVLLSLIFCFMGAFLSAFLDALTVMAVMITVANGFYSVYHQYHSTHSAQFHDDHEELNQFRRFLCDILMHGAVGTALGGVMTLVGEPQNLLIASIMKWHFIDFVVVMLPVTLPVLIMGLLTCVVVEKFKIFHYGDQLPEKVREILALNAEELKAKMDNKERARLIAQGVTGLLLILALAFHVAEVGLIGLSVIILLATFNGVTDEHAIGRAFQEALPFTSLLVVFFAVVGIIHEQHLFSPVLDWAMGLEGKSRIVAFFAATGILSMVSDNVFVATLFISEAQIAFKEGLLTQQELNLVAVAINTGTNIPSVATPNGQAAFLFLLTSSVSALVRLSYTRMIIMALPYTIVMSITGLLAVVFLL